MTYEPIAADLAVRLTQQHVHSARPDAPVVPDRPQRAHGHRFSAVRTVAAADLRRLAGWLEPSDSCAVVTSRS